MKVTFLIGNGFDLKMGMKTRYIDMYDSYIERDSNNDIIIKFKEILQADAPNKYTNWGDFEIMMAKKASIYENETDFVKCVRDFKNHMVEHLREQEKEFLKYANTFESVHHICADEFKKSLLYYYKGQIPNVINLIDAMNTDNNIIYNFVSFNYTRVFDYLLTQYEEYYGLPMNGSLVHVHGDLDNDVVLGVDNISQLGNLKFVPTKKIERAFIKPLFNFSYDKMRVDKVERIINDSDVICIYGMSMGLSDKTWINIISKWLISYDNHQLIYYQYREDKFDNWNSDEKMEAEDESKQKIISRLFAKEEHEMTYDRVHIPIGYDIFDIKNKLDNAYLTRKNNMNRIREGAL